MIWEGLTCKPCIHLQINYPIDRLAAYFRHKTHWNYCLQLRLIPILILSILIHIFWQKCKTSKIYLQVISVWWLEDCSFQSFVNQARAEFKPNFFHHHQSPRLLLFCCPMGHARQTIAAGSLCYRKLGA